MPVLYNLYSDSKCKESAKHGTIGVLYLNEALRNKANWEQSISEIPSRFVGGQTGLHIYTHFGINVGEASVPPNSAWFSLNRAYNGYGLFGNNYIITDTKTQSDTTPENNMFFISTHDNVSPTIETYDGSAIVLQIYSNLQYNTTPNTTVTVTASLFQYGQSPSPNSGNRTRWDYFTSSSQRIYAISLGQNNSSEYGNIGFVKITLPWGENNSNIDFVGIVSGFNDAGNFRSSGNITGGSIMLFPAALWTDATKTPTPYIGPVSKDSAESSFIPDRGLIHDSIASRDLTGIKNPYGFNSGALKLCKITNTAYGLLCAQIFNGSSGSILNQISQDVAALTGGNEHRNHDEVQAIQAGIMKIHLIPDITTIPTGTVYNISTIAGYKISGLVPVPAVPITDSMLVYSTPSVRILRTWKSYIDYEPYTTITLRIPYVGNINIPPSIIYDNAVSLTYHLDLFSGTLSVDIIIHDYTNGNSYIFSTLQANCAVSLPIAGIAAAGAPLLKIASGLLGVAMSGVGASANNIFSVISGLQDTKKSVPFGNFAQSNISAYFDSRHCYAIIQSVNPSNADTFLADKGYVAHLSGVVNDFAGSGTEMHCRFESVDLTGLSKLTEQEKQAVESMLKAGVHIRKV